MSDEQYNELERLLKQLQKDTILIDENDSKIAEKIQSQLVKVGVACVTLSDFTEHNIRCRVGMHTYNTFFPLQEKFKKKFQGLKSDMLNGNLKGFIKFFESTKCVDNHIAWTGSGMINPLPMLKNLRQCTFNNTDWYYNPLVSKNNLDMWQILSTVNPLIHPTNWYKDELKSRPADRVVVSDDGIKLKHHKVYTPTKLHYDGQLGDDENSARRIQIVYSNDKGGIRLMVTPGTHLPCVRKLITSITGQPYTGGFSGFGDFPKLSQILMKYSVAIPSTGLLMWRANVAHFEGVVIPSTNLQLLKSSPNNWTKKSFSTETKAASIFRIYCGVISVPFDTDMIKMAYLRQKGFGMIPTSRRNRQHVLFVNDKGFQGASRIGKDNLGVRWLKANNKKFKQEFSDIAESEIISTLQAIPTSRLSLYGLMRSDVTPKRKPEEAEIIIASLKKMKK